MSKRIRLSLVATLAGWAAALLVSLLFEIPELWRNAPPGGLLRDLTLGGALWTGFTLSVCMGVWCVVVLPLAIAVPAPAILRHRWQLTPASCVAAVGLIGWKLGTWGDLGGHGPVNPLTTPLFLTYAGFSFTLALVTTLVYSQLLAENAP